MVEPIQAKNGTFVVIDLRNWPNLGGTTGEPGAPRLIAELPLKLPPKAIDRVLADLATALPRWYDLLDCSFLSLVMRTAYRDVLQSRASLLCL